MMSRPEQELMMWGARFCEPAHPLLRALNDSFGFDFVLLEEDVEGSVAWADALHAAGILDPAELDRIRSGLEEILRESRDGSRPVGDFEDVHTYVEARLIEKAGDAAKKLHTGRSRNDQVATDFRLWMRKAASATTRDVLRLADALRLRAAGDGGTPMPGYTHLKQAEPVTFGHWCLAYVEMLLRDADRLVAAIERGDECPLGSGALAGTPVDVDRQALAVRLGFNRPTANSLDAVSDRDFAADYLYAASLLLVHLSRLAEDLIFLSSDEAGYLELPDALATGSSRMPHKKNPDLLELLRGRAARSIGDVSGFLALLKGLPLAYNKDLQLDKEPLFETRKALALLLPAAALLIDGISIDRQRMRAAASSGPMLATAAADALAAEGVAFREAHAAVGRTVANGSEGEYARPTIEEALARKAVFGGTAPERVNDAAAAAEMRIEAMRARLSGVAGGQSHE